MIAVNKAKRRPRIKELSKAQTVQVSFGEGLLQRTTPNIGTYTQLRAVRKDPTVSLVRGLLVGTIQAGAWNIEVDEDVDDKVLEYMNHLLPLREDFIYNVVAFGKVDFGWMPFEKIFEVKDGRIYIKELKPLLHDMTYILVTPHGRFNGFRQKFIGFGSSSWSSTGSTPSSTYGTGSSGSAMVYPLDLNVEKCLLASFGVEAGNYYGTPLLENIREAMDMWNEANDGARRYDKKLAGSHWVVKYPPGTGTIDGETTDNAEIAALVLAALESSGSVAIPTTTAEVLQELTSVEVANLYAWHVELLSDKGPRQASFSKRLTYLDSLKVRGLLMPERSVLEGQHGTKAEAGAHIGLMMSNITEIDKAITRIVNQQLVNPLLTLNFGKELVGKVRLSSAPLIDKQIGFLRELYLKAFTTPEGIDGVSLREKLNIPLEEVVVQPGSDLQPEPELT